MSDSLMACQPLMLEPSKPNPRSMFSSVTSRAGTEKCCHRPGKSMNLRSTTSTFSFSMNATISFGVLPTATSSSFWPVLDSGEMQSACHVLLFRANP